jgi:hypothetical protein
MTPKISLWLKEFYYCKTGPVWWVSTGAEGADIRKGCRKVNMVEI